MNSLRFPLALALAVACSSVVHAAATLEGINLGTPVTGPAITAADLTGKVVLFEYWGVNCPPCLASIPHLAEMRAKYGDDFVLIGNHCQGGDAAKVKSVWLSKNGGEDITVVNGGGLSGANVSGIPHAFLFDHTGKLIFDGRPGEIPAALEKAMAASPGAALAGADTSKFPTAAATLKGTGPITPLLKQLREAVAKGKDNAAQAQDLLDRFTKYATKGLESVTAARADDPVACITNLNRLSAKLKGDELAKPFEALLKELKTDKAFQTELKASDALARIEAAAGKIGLGSDPEALRRKKEVTEIANALGALGKSYPGTRAADQAKTLAVDWGLAKDSGVNQFK